jgi:uncharacterized membrane protein YeaQ/YmgE (transglycosylase-associated protein family)
MGFLILIIIGAAAGYIATQIMDVDMGMLPTIALGVIGAVLGGYALSLILSVMGIAAGFIGAVLGAVVLLWAYKEFVRRR